MWGIFVLYRTPPAVRLTLVCWCEVPASTAGFTAAVGTIYCCPQILIVLPTSDLPYFKDVLFTSCTRGPTSVCAANVMICGVLSTHSYIMYIAVLFFISFSKNDEDGHGHTELHLSMAVQFACWLLVCFTLFGVFCVVGAKNLHKYQQQLCLSALVSALQDNICLFVLSSSLLGCDVVLSVVLWLLEKLTRPPQVLNVFRTRIRGRRETQLVLVRCFFSFSVSIWHF